jgi:hypothetical protein
MSLVEDVANKEATETRVPFGKDEVITSPICICGILYFRFNVIGAINRIIQ